MSNTLLCPSCNKRVRKHEMVNIKRCMECEKKFQAAAKAEQDMIDNIDNSGTYVPLGDFMDYPSEG
jgi:ribosomal protein L37AE/L43A